MAKKKEGENTKNLTIQPIGDRVLIEREPSEEKTPGGIVLPDTAKDKPKRGKVISLGEGRLLRDGTRAPFQVKVGDRVVFSAYAGEELKVDDRELLLMREDDILAIIE
jgi:chaperonin GroES